MIVFFPLRRGLIRIMDVDECSGDLNGLRCSLCQSVAVLILIRAHLAVCHSTHHASPISQHGLALSQTGTRSQTWL